MNKWPGAQRLPGMYKNYTWQIRRLRFSFGACDGRRSGIDLFHDMAIAKAMPSDFSVREPQEQALSSSQTAFDEGNSQQV
jgi:hypothetical protein